MQTQTHKSSASSDPLKVCFFSIGATAPIQALVYLHKTLRLT
jgi:hypothetical protein